MIKFDTVSTSYTTKRADKKKSARGSDNGFSSLMGLFGTSASEVTDETAYAETAALNETSALSSLDMILSVQGVPDFITKRQQAIKQANLALDGLETLRNALLLGQVPLYLLHDVERRMHDMRTEVDDPLLIDIIEDIELRAAVEVAKYKMSRD